MIPFEKLGPYIIEETIGSGGMGSVYLGKDERTGQRAAVKILAPGLAADENFRERFLTEVETLKKLKHPNIVQLLGYGEEAGQLFYAMEMVPGRNLQQEMLAGRRFDWREVAKIGIEVCEALKHAHDRGVIHRDLKPANLLYTEDDTVKLLDFGIAKLYGMTQLTAEGGVLGTADYMSPEQAEGKGVTARSDLYSLGSVMFALLTGRPPFAASSLPEVVHKLRYDEAPPLRRVCEDVPEEFESIVSQLLEKDPHKRIATARALGNRLKAMEYALSVETRIDHSSGTEEEDEYRIVTDDGGPDDSPDAPTAITRIVESKDDSLQRHRDATVAVSDVFGMSQDADSSMDSPPQSRTASTHFTTFDEEARKRATSPSDSEDTTPLWLKVAPLLAAGIVIALAIWYFSRPATADQLYRQISAAAAEEETRELLNVEDEMEEFLQRFPDDQRRSEVQSLREELEMYRRQRRYERQAKLRRGANSKHPVERVYLEAIRLADEDPYEAMTKLKALLSVYDGMNAEDDEDLQSCLQLARAKIAELADPAEQTAKQHLSLLSKRLDAAAQLSESDPDKAMAIYQGIIALYQDKAWADSAVSTAREALK